MAIDTSPSTVATNALSAIPYGALIGGPLDACIKAQATSAMTTVDFIRKVGFRQTPGGEDEVVNVVFTYVKDGQRCNLIVPLLAIVPVPFISVDQITIDFKANISAESSSVNEESSASSFTGEASGGLSFGVGPFSIKVDFKANYSSKKDSKATQQSKYSVEYTMDIHVAASQADMPAGLAKVLNILEANISALPAGGKLTVKPVDQKIPVPQADVTLPLEIVVQDGKGAGVKAVDIESAVSPDPGGKLIVSAGQTDASGLATLNVTAKQGLAAGTYVVKLEGNGLSGTFRLDVA